MFRKIQAGWEVLQIGKEVANPALWKRRQDFGNRIGGLILALAAFAKAFGYELPIDTEAALIVGGGISVVFNIVLTYATSRKAGLPTEHKADIDPHQDHYIG